MIPLIRFPVSFAVSLVGQDDCIYVFGGLNSTSDDDDAISNAYKYNTTAGSPKGLFGFLFCNF